MRREDGFTLAEIVVVLAVISILMGVIAINSNYWLQEQSSMSLEALNEQGNQALVTYYTIYGRFPFEVCTNPDGSAAVKPGDPPVTLSEEQSEALMGEIKRVTSQRTVQNYDTEQYKITVTYSNKYVAEIHFERR